MARKNTGKEESGGRGEWLRRLPSVDELLRQEAALIARHGRAVVTRAVRAALDEVRAEIAAGRLDEAALMRALEQLPQQIERQAQRDVSYSLRPVINATGVILHTNLGRAPLARAAVEHIAATAGGYTNLEFDIAAGERGRRDVHAGVLGELLEGAAGPVASIVVNNNAAAVLLALNTLGEGGEVIVSRGELVEVGGSFRIPDVMAKSGAALREVGTTNRTRLADYEQAINERTRALLRVHRSNFEIVGFTEQPSLAELVALGRRYKLPVVEDLGSGALLDLASLGLANEPGVSASLRAGVDVVTYSGDKLLGGPQAGILSGPAEMIARLRKNPLFRALRVDKLTYAALEATLVAYLREDFDGIPTLRMMRLVVAEIEQRAAALARRIGDALAAEVCDGTSLFGGGSAPGQTLPTKLLAVRAPELSAQELARRLRRQATPVIARVEDDRVLLDLRTVFPEQDEAVAAALRQAAQSQD
jgi:L-seryl-tRNA(Ser) seleniumtransferase